MKKFLWSVFGVGALLVGAQAVYSAVDSQQFTVSVPKRVSITAPTAAVRKDFTLTELVDADLVGDDTYTFDDQTWAVKGNVKNGVTVDFVAAPFAYEVSPFQANGPLVSDDVAAVVEYQNAGLSVVVASNTGPATWTLDGTGAEASSNYLLASPNALVSYKSDKVGQADFTVSVAFLATDLNNVMAGEYVTTVVGTLTEN